jgi:hypothetical protein
VTRNIEQVLGGKRQTGKRPTPTPFDVNASVGDKGIDVILHVGPQDAGQKSLSVRNSAASRGENGAAGGYRTYDLSLTKGVLYH